MTGMRKSKTLVAMGLIFVTLFFLLAPRSPLRNMLVKNYGSIVDQVDILFGLLALILVLSGYISFQFEKYPRNLAIYNTVMPLVGLSWFLLAEATGSLVLHRQGLIGLIEAMTLTFPATLPSYFILRRISRGGSLIWIVRKQNEKSSSKTSHLVMKGFNL